jgi:hypothetical protein
MFQTDVVEKIKTHILLFTKFPSKIVPLCNNSEKYSRAEQATDDNTSRAHVKLDTLGYRHALRVRNTYCFSMAAMVA